MLTESGRVVAIEDEHLWVETINRSACGSCQARAGCGQRLLARWAEKSTHLKLPLGHHTAAAFAVDDRVLLGIPEDVIVKSSMLIYCLPIALLLVGAAVGQLALESEAASIVGALSGLGLGGLLVKVYSRFSARSRHWEPVILGTQLSAEQAPR